MTISYIIHYLESIVEQQMRGFSIISFVSMSLIMLILLFWVMFLYYRIRGRMFFTWDFLKTAFLLAYMCFMFQVAIYRREPGTRHLISVDIDFGSLSGDFLAVQQVVYCVLNIAFFIPFGMFTALLRWHFDRNESIVKDVIMVTLCCFLMSFSIECIQLLTATGFFELTDIIVNTVGGFCGAILMIFLLKILQRTFKNEKGKD